jgi:hypothetical protein
MRALERLDIYSDDVTQYSSSEYYIPLTKSNAENLRNFRNVTSVTGGKILLVIFPGLFFLMIRHIPGTKIISVPLVMPSKGMTVAIDKNNISKYHRIIEAYEHNTSR